jgi:hypothetical protein
MDEPFAVLLLLLPDDVVATIDEKFESIAHSTRYPLTGMPFSPSMGGGLIAAMSSEVPRMPLEVRRETTEGSSGGDDGTAKSGEG